MTSPFAPPAQGGDTAKPADLAGHLLIVKPNDYRTGILTSFGEKDAVSVDLVDLDDVDPDTGEVGHQYHGALWFSGALVGSCKNQIGTLVLARMSQGTAKAGQSPPWLLADATTDAAAVQAGALWLSSHPEFRGLSAPTPAPAPVAAPPVQAAAAAAPVAAPSSTAAPKPVGPGGQELTPEMWAALQQLQQSQPA